MTSIVSYTAPLACRFDRCPPSTVPRSSTTSCTETTCRLDKSALSATARSRTTLLCSSQSHFPLFGSLIAALQVVLTRRVICPPPSAQSRRFQVGGGCCSDPCGVAECAQLLWGLGGCTEGQGPPLGWRISFKPTMTPSLGNPREYAEKVKDKVKTENARI